MDTQNVTLSLPKALLRKVKLLAVERGTSVSRLLTGLLEETVAREDGYGQARRRALAQMKRGFPIGARDKITWSRDDLHER